MNNNDQPSTPDCAQPATTYSLSDHDEKVSHLHSGSQCLPLYLRRFTGGWVYATILSHCVEYLEKQRKYEDANLVLKDLLAQNGFCTSSRGRWWDRLALNLEFHLGRKEEVSNRIYPLSLTVCVCVCVGVGGLPVTALTLR